MTTATSTLGAGGFMSWVPRENSNRSNVSRKKGLTGAIKMKTASKKTRLRKLNHVEIFFPDLDMNGCYWMVIDYAKSKGTYNYSV